MKKHFSAILIAFLMTAFLGVAMLAIGVAALFNRNGVPVSDSTAQVLQAADTNLSHPSQTAQLQDLVAQYQDRERQYQQREQQLQEQLAQANTQVQQDRQMIQQVQMLLSALQQRGLINVTADGRITIN